MRAKQKREWHLKTIKIGNYSWFPRDDIGHNIHGYMKCKGSPWAGRVTGMILEGNDEELAGMMQNEKSLIKRIEEAIEVLKNNGFCVLARDDGSQVIMKKTRERHLEESE